MEYKRCKPIIGSPEKWLDTRQNQNYNRSVLLHKDFNCNFNAVDGLFSGLPLL
jgi:hypothetical protein